MRLLKIKHDLKGTWYFTNIHKAAEYIGTSSTYVKDRMNEGKTIKKWTAEWVDDDNILSKYINVVNTLKC